MYNSCRNIYLSKIEVSLSLLLLEEDETILKESNGGGNLIDYVFILVRDCAFDTNCVIN